MDVLNYITNSIKLVDLLSKSQLYPLSAQLAAVITFILAPVSVFSSYLLGLRGKQTPQGPGISLFRYILYKCFFAVAIVWPFLVLDESLDMPLFGPVATFAGHSRFGLAIFLTVTYFELFFAWFMLLIYSAKIKEGNA